MFAISSNIITWIIITVCSLVRWRTSSPVSTYLFPCFISTFHHSSLHHFIHFAYYIIHNYSGGGSKFIQNYQGYKEALLFQFEKVELIKGWGAFQVTSLGVSHFPSLKSFQEHPNEVERKGLAQKKNNLMLYIFGCFYLILWWKAKTISGSTTYPF